MTSDDLGVAPARFGRPWTVVRHEAPADVLHGLEVPVPAAPEVWLLRADRPALVLGSTQGLDIVAADALAAHGIDLVRRRSGGGAVLLDTAGRLGGPPTLWIDLIVPRGDPLWLDDVGRSMDWLGETWVRALTSIGIQGAVHRGPLERTAASTLVCFAGLGPGEVVVGGRKAVGISQRRTRAGARFQCVVHLAAAPPASGPGIELVADLLVEPRDAARRVELVELLRARATPIVATADDLVDAFLGALPGTVA
jgi:lipoate-protein ligase A